MDVEKFLKKNKINEGQLVKLINQNEEYLGSIMPSSGKEKDIIRLKMDSGYNVGIKINENTKIKKIEGIKNLAKAKHSEMKPKKDLPTIAILHTGGTIASRVDYRTGAVYSSFNPQDLLTMFPELLKIANFSSKLIRNMWSDDLRFNHFEVIGKAIKKAYEEGNEGIIIGMGTDNMAVASAAMSFVLEECPIPVIFVGAQRSSDRGSSDAAMNLICATEFITKTNFAGVGICMHENSNDNKCMILPACKTRKMHSSRRDAFQAINDTPIALINYKTKEIEFLKKEYQIKSKEKIVLKPKFEEKTGFLKIHINMFPEEFEFFLKNKYKGLVIEGTGLGHTPGHNPDGETKIHEKFFPILKKLNNSGCVIVMTTQTINGRVHLHVYDKGTDLVAQGVISGEDMHAETAFVKLAWLLGNYKPEEVKKLIGKNLRGEINKATPYDKEFKK